MKLKDMEFRGRGQGGGVCEVQEARDRIYGRRGGGSKGYLVPEQQQSSIVSICPDLSGL